MNPFNPDRMQVTNIRDLVRYHHQSCSPLQYLRELTVNSIQSIMRKPTQKGIITWDVNWDYYKVDQRICKLAITDTGDGIEPSKMELYLNQLVSGIKTDENFGIGGKISAVPSNEMGTIYESWSMDMWDSQTPGKTIRIGKIGDDYGLMDVGESNTFAYLDQDDAPKIIRDAKSGTRVTLFGNSEYENTMNAPEGVKGTSRWITKYLNGKLFAVPDEIDIFVREWSDRPPRNQTWLFDSSDVETEEDSFNFLRKIQTMSVYLQQNSLAHGEVRISGKTDNDIEVPATAYWWILDDEKTHRSFAQNYGMGGAHAACLYENNHVTEIYDVKSRHMLKQFGVFSKKDVIIYIKPDTIPGLSPTGSRDRLKIGQYEMPWNDWASSFSAQLPPEISDLFEQRQVKTDIKELLKDLYELLKIPSKSNSKVGPLHEHEDFKPEPDGPHMGSGAGQDLGKGRWGGKRKGSTASSAGQVPSVISSRIKKPINDQPNDVFDDNIPKIIWTSTDPHMIQEYKLDERTIDEDVGDELDDKAAIYYEGPNTLHINFDFRIFQSHLNYLIKQYIDKDIPSKIHRQIIVQEAMRASEIALVEVILGIKNLNWSRPQQMQALSPIALTSAAISFYHKRQVVIRNVGQALNQSLKKKGSKESALAEAELVI